MITHQDVPRQYRSDLPRSDHDYRPSVKYPPIVVVPSVVVFCVFVWWFIGHSVGWW